MTEKRFTLAYETNDQNVLWWAVRDRDIILWKEEVVGLLNELSDKCDFLEIENESLEDGATKYTELYHKSLKENEQLKKDFNSCSHNWGLMYDEAKDKIEELSNENEQLKKILGFLKNDNAEDILNVLNSQENIVWELKQENEQLKKDVEDLRQTLALINGELGEMEDLK